MSPLTWPKRADGLNMTVGEMSPDDRRAQVAASVNRVMGRIKPECPYCSTTEGLRIKCDGYGSIAPEYTCEACFTGTDTGPSFDDLKPA